MNEVSQVERYLFSKVHFLVRDNKHVVVQVYAQFWKISGLVWSRHGYFQWLDIRSRQNTNHGSTKLALLFSRIEQKPARLHIRTSFENSCVPFKSRLVGPDRRTDGRECTQLKRQLKLYFFFLRCEISSTLLK